MHELTAVLEEPSAVENSQIHSPMSQYFVPVHTTCFYIRVKRKKKKKRLIKHQLMMQSNRHSQALRNVIISFLLILDILTSCIL